ncbi:trichohyalin-like, partial [Pollicipes pollicipes]|uniref:trichohyalin-like n=1 Tax=Pollicipes pollicipes TaxID=41117 RepID=UPI00188595CC
MCGPWRAAFTRDELGSLHKFRSRLQISVRIVEDRGYPFSGRGSGLMEPVTPEPATPPLETTPGRRIPARNTPTLRSATREQLAEARDEPEPEPEPEAEREPRPAAVRPARQPVGCRKRGRDAIEDDKKSDAPPEKIKRTWEKWSTFDKTIFFEALNEFGKNFEALQTYIAKKKSKNRPDQVRNRDQIRFFYYRTLNKISKYVQFPTNVKRYIQEIYLLVNYGELRKRITKLNERSGQRLNELVYRGSTAVRLRGKTYRIRTPVCRALKKINRIQDPVEEPFVRLPARTQVELTPADNESWYRVQALSHNPRLRATLPLQHRLRSLLLALEKRWRSDADRALRSASPDDPPPPPARRLVLRATADYKLSAQVIRPAPPAPLLNLCFERYQERMTLLEELQQQRLEKSQQQRQEKPQQRCPEDEQERERLRRQLEEAARRRDEEELREEQERSRLEQERRQTERIQRSELDTGWTAETAGTRTIGELYMMVNRPERIRLQYFWLPENVSGHELSTTAGGSKPSVKPVEGDVPDTESADHKWAEQLADARSLVAPGDTSAEGRRVKMLTSMLSQLLNLARLSKVKTERSRVGPLVTCGTQTPPSLAPRPAGTREQLYYLSAGVRPPDPRRPVRIAPAYKSMPPPANDAAGVMRPPLETALRDLPRYNNRRGRVGRKSQVVVQRMLPLMPRTQPNQISMVNLRLVAGVMRPPLETALRDLPRYNNRRGRVGRKSQVVVQRMLPLMPRTQPNQISMVNLRLVAGVMRPPL